MIAIKRVSDDLLISEHFFAVRHAVEKWFAPNGTSWCVYRLDRRNEIWDGDEFTEEEITALMEAFEAAVVRTAGGE